MQRCTERQLLSWKNSSGRTPLIVRGARHVGKTWSIERLGEAEFDDVVKVDLEKRPEIHQLFRGNLSPGGLVEQLEVATGRRILPGRTLLFLDEIQTCPRAIVALGYFSEEKPALHVIAAASLPESALGEISVPVGRVASLNMYPMNFQEYLLAMGNEPAADAIMREPTGLAESTHQALLQALRRYFFVGGLPECVAAAADGGSLLDVFALQDDILSTYRDDFAKYAGRADKTCLDAVLLHVARQVGRQIKYTQLGDGHTGPTNHKAFDLLCGARVIHKIPSASPTALPLGATANKKRFKAAFLDIGLMQRLGGLPVDREMQHHDLLDIHGGRLAEQFVAQELLVTHQGELFYWSRETRGSQAEVDFLAARDGRIHPVEVTSGAGGQLRSMRQMLQTCPGCGDGLVLSGGAYGRRAEQRLVFLPLYYAGALGPRTQASWSDSSSA